MRPTRETIDVMCIGTKDGTSGAPQGYSLARYGNEARPSGLYGDISDPLY